MIFYNAIVNNTFTKRHHNGKKRKHVIVGICQQNKSLLFICRATNICVKVLQSTNKI